jgi:hypothetical protein
MLLRLLPLLLWASAARAARVPEIVDYYQKEERKQPRAVLSGDAFNLWDEPGYRVTFRRRTKASPPETLDFESIILTLDNDPDYKPDTESAKLPHRGEINLRSAGFRTPASPAPRRPTRLLAFRTKRLPPSRNPTSTKFDLITVAAQARENPEAHLDNLKLGPPDVPLPVTRFDLAVKLLDKPVISAGPFERDIFWWAVKGTVGVKIGEKITPIGPNQIARIPRETTETVGLVPISGAQAFVLQIRIRP